MAQDIIINQNPHQQVFQSLTAKSLKRNNIEVLLLVMSSQAVISKKQKVSKSVANAIHPARDKILLIFDLS